MSAFLNSLIIASLTALMSLLIGLPLAILIFRANIPFKRFFSCVYLIPIFIPPAISCVTWVSLIGDCKAFYSIPGAVFILTLCYFPFVTLLSAGGLSAIGRDLEDAASLDFTTAGVLKSISLPCASNYILTGVIFVFVFALSNYEVPAMLGVRTFPVEIFAQFSAFYNTRLAFLYSLPLIGLCGILILFVAKPFLHRDYFVAIDSAWQKPNKMKLSAISKIIGLCFAGVLLFAAVFLPVITLLKKSSGAGVYQKALSLSVNEILFSLLLAAVGATVICLLSFIVAYYLARKRGLLRNLVYYLSILPLAIPATVYGIILIKVFNRPSLNLVYSTPLILLIGYCIRFSPFTIRIMESTIRHIDRCYEEEAMVDGAYFSRRLFMIIGPLSSSGLLISWIVAFVLIMGEIGLTVLVIPPGNSTLILKIYTLMHYGSGKLVAALSILSVLIICIPVLVLAYGRKVIKGFASVLVISSLLISFSAASSALDVQDSRETVYSTWDLLELDTCVSAWLIKRHVDKKAVFKFYPKGELIEEGIAFDTPDAEFRRTHNSSTFESILKKYNIKDKKLIGLGKIIHKIEVNYWAGNLDSESQELNQTILDIIDNAKSPQDALIKSFAYFDNLQ